MARTEVVTITNMCMVYNGTKVLVQEKIDDDYSGITFPGGHVEKGEYVTPSVIREMKEETGLTILNPQLCGVKHFPIKDGKYENGRYLVFLFKANQFSGDIISSEEGNMHWIKKEDLANVNLVSDFYELIKVMLDDNLSEFQYVVENDKWNIIQK